MARFVIIKKGDTLTKLAKTYGCKVQEIRDLNPGIKKDIIYIGEKLLIPSLKSVGSTPTPKIVEDDNRWYFPVLPWKQYNNNVGKFLDQEYLRIVGSQHPGCDINGNNGGNTDFGQPVYAIHKGVVVDATFYPVWGNIVKIYHPDAGIWSVYAHLNEMLVKKGDKVSGRTRIGGIGRGENNVYLAHLHFEIRVKDLPTNIWPSGRYGNGKKCVDFIRNNYVDGVRYLLNKGAIAA